MEKEKILVDYLVYLGSSYQVNEIIGRRIKRAYDYVNKGYDISCKGWKDYLKIELSKDLTCKFSIVKRDIFDFLGFNGVSGYRNRKKTKKVKPLEKLTVISAKNQELIRTFNNKLLTEGHYSDHTIRGYNYSLKMFFEYCNEFSKDNYRRYISMLEEQKKKPKTICLHISSLNKFADILGKQEYKMRLPKIARTLQLENIPSVKEYQTLLDYLKEKNKMVSYYQVKLIASTGARLSEFLQFEWEHIAQGYIDLKGKGNKIRRFFFTESLAREMTDYAQANNRNGYVFINMYGTKIHGRGFAQQLNFWAEKAGLDSRKFHPHAFRHFFAKMYLNRNSDVVQLSNLLGHESVDMTRTYLTKTFEEQQNDYNKTVIW